MIDEFNQNKFLSPIDPKAFLLPNQVEDVYRRAVKKIELMVIGSQKERDRLEEALKLPSFTELSANLTAPETMV